MRAAHMVLDGEPKILNDTVVPRLMGATAVESLKTRAVEFDSDAARGLRTHVILRSRFAEDRLAEAVADRRIEQCINLGAGGDTFAYRQPEWAKGICVTEVDHPASQAGKRERLAAAGFAIPPNVSYAPIDLETSTLRDGLIANRVDLTVPTVFSWLGVTMYLTEAAIDEVLHTIIGFPSGTEVVLTFARRKRPARDGVGGPSLAERAASIGEPWLSYFEPDEIDAKLRAFGFSDVY
ncbi:MAG: class I SAM-dependent methyltransferase, partial [Gemmatimonadaceae bacterium]